MRSELKIMCESPQTSEYELYKVLIWIEELERWKSEGYQTSKQLPSLKMIQINPNSNIIEKLALKVQQEPSHDPDLKHGDLSMV